jgi:hypothetical protein
MATRTEICNQALALLGESPITSYDADNTAVAGACRAFYPSARDACLRDHPWGFAKLRVQLAEAATTPVYGWDHQHILPADYIRLLHVENVSKDEWEVEGRMVLSDLATVKCQYIRRVAEGEFDPLFEKALAAYLASELSYPITESNTKGQQMFSLYGLRKEQAGTISNLEGVTKQSVTERLLLVR